MLKNTKKIKTPFFFCSFANGKIPFRNTPLKYKTGESSLWPFFEIFADFLRLKETAHIKRADKNFPKRKGKKHEES